MTSAAPFRRAVVPRPGVVARWSRHRPRGRFADGWRTRATTPGAASDCSRVKRSPCNHDQTPCPSTDQPYAKINEVRGPHGPSLRLHRTTLSHPYRTGGRRQGGGGARSPAGSEARREKRINPGAPGNARPVTGPSPGSHGNVHGGRSPRLRRADRAVPGRSGHRVRHASHDASARLPASTPQSAAASRGAHSSGPVGLRRIALENRAALGPGRHRGPGGNGVRPGSMRGRGSGSLNSRRPGSMRGRGSGSLNSRRPGSGRPRPSDRANRSSKARHAFHCLLGDAAGPFQFLASPRDVLSISPVAIAVLLDVALPFALSHPFGQFALDALPFDAFLGRGSVLRQRRAEGQPEPADSQHCRQAKPCQPGRPRCFHDHGHSPLKVSHRTGSARQNGRGRGRRAAQIRCRLHQGGRVRPPALRAATTHKVATFFFRLAQLPAEPAEKRVPPIQRARDQLQPSHPRVAALRRCDNSCASTAARWSESRSGIKPIGRMNFACFENKLGIHKRRRHAAGHQQYDRASPQSDRLCQLFRLQLHVVRSRTSLAQSAAKPDDSPRGNQQDHASSAQPDAGNDGEGIGGKAIFGRKAAWPEPRHRGRNRPREQAPAKRRLHRMSRPRTSRRRRPGPNRALDPGSDRRRRNESHDLPFGCCGRNRDREGNVPDRRQHQADEHEQPQGVTDGRTPDYESGKQRDDGQCGSRGCV